jgi:hypothetical protein
MQDEISDADLDFTKKTITNPVETSTKVTFPVNPPIAWVEYPPDSKTIFTTLETVFAI